MIQFKNGWKSGVKQNDKLIIEIRIGILSIFELYVDRSDNTFMFGICNFFIHN